MKTGSLSAAAERVAHAVLRSGPVSATELAAELGLTPAGVRRQLDILVEAGLIEGHERAPYGPRSASASGPRRRGRPAKVFTVTAAGRDSLERVRDDIGLEAMRFIASTQGTEGLRAFASARAAATAKRYAARVEAARGAHPADSAVGAQAAVAALADALTEDGYEAEVVPGGATGIQLCQRNCPVAEVASEFEVICEAEAEAFAEILGTHVTRLATLAHGDGLCTAHILTDQVRMRNPSQATLRPGTKSPKSATGRKNSRSTALVNPSSGLRSSA